MRCAWIYAPTMRRTGSPPRRVIPSRGWAGSRSASAAAVTVVTTPPSRGCVHGTAQAVINSVGMSEPKPMRRATGQTGSWPSRWIHGRGLPPRPGGPVSGARHRRHRARPGSPARRARRPVRHLAAAQRVGAPAHRLRTRQETTSRFREAGAQAVIRRCTLLPTDPPP